MADATTTVVERYVDAHGADATRTYTRGRFLGKGGFARCYEMTAPDGATYAAKVVAKETLLKPKAKIKFASEIKIHKALHHPRVVQMHHFFEDDANCYLLLELCPNHSLSDLIKRRKRLAEHEVRFYIKQLLEGIQYLHSQCVIHRDLKLGNLFLTSDMQIKIGDFGLASHLDSKAEKRKTMCGTPNYIAPEILNGARNDGHSFEVDVWSTGVIMYTLLVGKPPFETADVKNTYRLIRANTYTFPDTVALSSAARGLIIDILRHDPTQRPSITSILKHPFLRDDNVPRHLPESSLFMTPPRPLGAKPDAPKTPVPTPSPHHDKPPLRTPLRTLHQANQAAPAAPDVLEATCETLAYLIALDEERRGKHNAENAILSTTKQQILQARLAVLPPPRAAPLWVLQYVDYTAKYGLGYVLSNGSAGVYFNDSTKIIASPDGSTFDYVDRLDAPAVDSPRTTFSAKQFDAALAKKVTLMGHFQEYMKEEEPTCSSRTLLLSHLEKLPPQFCTASPVYIRKWVKTRHAILFRLTNDTIQVDFYDSTRLVLAQDGLAITYVDKDGTMHVLSTYDAVQHPAKTPDLVKRLKYVKDMLAQMVKAKA
ncbi:PLK/PLK-UNCLASSIFIED protein kinase [Saprolegnia diclina VS20]|uniref:Serine/threonine-protein kinase PLK n=1 Tax=Saprolegnia diclina (strain VS20) TaxID=1156394 RepID=T0PZ32_SAPDV|nr:PLK/PLK-UNCLASSIFIED protein kinase [Saprolegnia diclina VS20]EQC30829.1 PLK/PLK-UNCLASSIFIED protein kinase [Saprolegnia diclina VS20]|eukprot:XP_008615853.1 PLK/PLK-UNCLASSIFIED protein kinase [Saprolegnia diclina VS20]